MSDILTTDRVEQNQPLPDVEAIRKEFPILNQEVHGNPLIYMDNAATTQKPEAVLSAIDKYYRETNSNIHRGVHHLSEKATAAYEDVRTDIKDFINAGSTAEIIFTRGTTESVNLVASSYGRSHLGEGDEILISTMEHHSNIIPWQLLCEEKNATLKIIPINDRGEIIMEDFKKLVSEKTRLIAVVHVSNSLGTINPVEEMIEFAHSRDIPVLLDGAQACPHMAIDVQKLDCDFFAFSGHKMFGPTGIGVLYGKEKHLEQMPPYQGGGEMIDVVTFEKTTYKELPHKFEAGTPNIAGTIGLGAAIKYIGKIGYDNIAAHENDLLAYGTQTLLNIKGLNIIGTAKNKCSVLSFTLDNIHPLDIGTLLNTQGIAVRTGHHCTQPIMDRYGIVGTSRASLAFYNTRAELDKLAAGIEQVIQMFS